MKEKSFRELEMAGLVADAVVAGAVEFGQVANDNEAIGKAKFNILISIDHGVTNTQLRDMVAFIEFCNKKNLGVAHCSANLLHDINGIVNNEPCFLPRTSGYHRKMNRTEIKVYGSNLPVCPKCGNHNALLDYRDFDQEDRPMYLECRDCNFKIYANETTVIFLQLDKPGMGIDSTYTEIKRMDGEKWLR